MVNDKLLASTKSTHRGYGVLKGSRYQVKLIRINPVVLCDPLACVPHHTKRQAFIQKNTDFIFPLEFNLHRKNKTTFFWQWPKWFKIKNKVYKLYYITGAGRFLECTRLTATNSQMDTSPKVTNAGKSLWANCIRTSVFQEFVVDPISIITSIKINKLPFQQSCNFTNNKEIMFEVF